MWRFEQFRQSQGGVSAVEFALITPLLFFLYMGSIEMPRVVTIGSHLAQSAEAMAVLISRDDLSDLGPVYAVAQAILSPYEVRGAGVVLTTGGVYQVGTAMVTKACSSAQQNDQARAVGSTLGPPPAGLEANGDRFVMAEIKMRYNAIFPILPTLNNWTFSYQKIWPIRGGKTYNGQPEVVLPGGKPCPLSFDKA